MRESLATLAERRVPRYTSYPTAPHFNGSVDGATLTRWLAEIPPATPLSLYLHVPFCRQICWYCACNMKLVSREEPVLEYADWLGREIDLVAERLPAAMPVTAIHWGGGTPTAMPMAALSRITERLQARFRVAEDAETAFEIDPRSFEPGMAAGLAARGANRATRRGQEINPVVQAAVNRIQSFDRVRATVDALLAAGIRGVNFDLMYGLPYQTTSMLLRTVEASLALFPDRIALFGYAHVPWMARNQRLLPGEALPGAAERFEQAEAAGALLEERGYVRIGLDHFARPEDPMAQAAADGTLKRSFQGYTVDAAEGLIGLGTTAISTLPQGYAQNLPETRGWSRALAEGRLPVHRGIALSAEDRLRHAVIERLMCDLGVDAAAVARAHGFRSHHFAAVYGRLQELVEAGLVHLEGTRITVPEAARPALRIVASVFDAYLAPEQPGRHSVAI